MFFFYYYLIGLILASVFANCFSIINSGIGGILCFGFFVLFFKENKNVVSFQPGNFQGGSSNVW